MIWKAYQASGGLDKLPNRCLDSKEDYIRDIEYLSVRLA